MTDPYDLYAGVLYHWIPLRFITPKIRALKKEKEDKKKEPRE